MKFLLRLDTCNIAFTKATVMGVCESEKGFFFVNGDDGVHDVTDNKTPSFCLDCLDYQVIGIDDRLFGYNETGKKHKLLVF